MDWILLLTLLGEIFSIFALLVYAIIKKGFKLQTNSLIDELIERNKSLPTEQRKIFFWDPLNVLALFIFTIFGITPVGNYNFGLTIIIEIFIWYLLIIILFIIFSKSTNHFFQSIFSALLLSVITARSLLILFDINRINQQNIFTNSLYVPNDYLILMIFIILYSFIAFIILHYYIGSYFLQSYYELAIISKTRLGVNSLFTKRKILIPFFSLLIFLIFSVLFMESYIDLVQLIFSYLGESKYLSYHIVIPFIKAFFIPIMIIIFIDLYFSLFIEYQQYKWEEDFSILTATHAPTIDEAYKIKKKL